ncbi:hypothetical protein BH10ACT2_BH10ACT2_24340 [soil metagenome]
MPGVFARVKSAGLDRFGFHVAVEDVQAPESGFALITLVGDGLTKSTWHPGDCVKVRTPDDQLRSYTPLDWDAVAGRTRLLGVGRATGPGTRYLNALAVGAQVQLVGPKKSVDLNLERAPIIVGDETVLSLCAAWATSSAEPAIVVLEASDVTACQSAAIAIGVAPNRVEPTRADLVAAVIETARANPDLPLVLSGRAQSIAAVRAALKSADLNTHGKGNVRRTIRVKAYWDEHRTGLD